MRTRVEKLPIRLAVVIPESLAAQAGLRVEESADVEVAGGQLIVRPSRPSSLAELLAGITPKNLHGEWAGGPPVGAELL